jgi:riboflavin biosynthesis pyrimidine reductase
MEGRAMLNVQQVLPVKKLVPLRGLYLGQRLMELSTEIGRSVVLADFLTDKNGIVATADKSGKFRIPAALRNPSDWRLFQELMAQADVIISGGAYFKSPATARHGAQDILHQFEPGQGFEELGQWRLSAGCKQRSPDLAIITRDLDFELPEALIGSGRKIIIFTTDAIANSDKAHALNDAHLIVIGSGEAGVDGPRLIGTLSDQMGYRVIMMASGPSMLELLLSARLLDLLYITQAQREIPSVDSASVRTIISGGRKIDELEEFRLSHEFVQDDVVTEDGSRISQFFLKYGRKEIRE